MKRKDTAPINDRNGNRIGTAWRDKNGWYMLYGYGKLYGDLESLAMFIEWRDAQIAAKDYKDPLVWPVNRTVERRAQLIVDSSGLVGKVTYYEPRTPTQEEQR